MNKKEILKKIGKENWKKFEDYFVGKTVLINEDGTTDFFDWDVENFIRFELKFIPKGD